MNGESSFGGGGRGKAFRIRCGGVSILLIAFWATLCVLAQGRYYGGITGTVTDPTGAVIPGVEITVTSLAKGTVIKTISGDTGLYRLENLKPGDSYRVEAELPGFKRYVREPILVESNRTVTVDIPMEIGETTQEVTVHGAPPILETESGQTTVQLEGDLIYLVPFGGAAGRSGLGEFAAGIAAAHGGDAGRITVAGARTTQIDLAVDGAPDRGVRDGAMMQQHNISVDTLRAEKTTLVNANAESRAPAQVNYLTRSGSNQFHGSLFHQAFHSAFSAFTHSTPIANRTSAKRTFQRYLYYGGTASGPVYIPKLYDGRDRTFWLMSVELLGMVTQSPGYLTVPTSAMLNGDFSALRDSSGKLIPIKDPVTGQPFAGNVIPTNRINAGVVNYLKAFYPLPNQQTTAFSQNYWTSNSTTTNVTRPRVDVRVDHKLSDQNNFFVRWSRNSTTYLYERWGIGNTHSVTTLDSYQVNDTHTFTNRLLNEFRLAKMGNAGNGYNDRRPAETIAMLGVKGIPQVLIDNATGLPAISVSNLSGLGQTADSTTYERTYDFFDAASYLRQRHSFKAGVNVRRDAHTTLTWPTAGNFAFDGFFSGFGLSDFLLGLPHTSRREYPRSALGTEDRRGWYTGFFVQDDFKMTPRLTLNLGLRWDITHPVVETHGFYYNLDLATGNLVMPSQESIDRIVPTFNTTKFVPVTGEAAGFPEHLKNTDWNNLAPRIGLAWRPFGEHTVIRAAYGIYIDQPSFQYLPTTGPWGGTETFTNKLVSGVPWFQFPAAFPEGAAGSIPGTVSAGAFNPDRVNPYVQQWNLTAERQQGAQVFRVQYVGTKSTNLAWVTDLNTPEPSTTPFSNSRRPWPQYSTVNYWTQGGSGSYHAMVLAAERRLSGGNTFTSTFAWASLLTDSYNFGSDRSDLQSLSGRWYPTLDRARWRGKETDVPKLRWTTVWLAELPFGEGKRWGKGWHPVVDTVLGGWIWSGLFNWETGSWCAPYYGSGVDPANINVFYGPPDRVGNGGLKNVGLNKGDTFFDTSAFVMPPANSGRLGNSGTNFWQTPSFWMADFTLGKSFRVRESVRLEFDSKFFDVFNHARWYNSNVFSAGLNVNDKVNFGKVAGDMLFSRQIQFIARLNW